MPAPLARGLIFSISILFAAGLAAYENPQVRAWIDGQRRRIAVALHSLGDDFEPEQQPQQRLPHQPQQHPGSGDDASMREEPSPEAAARRRRARQEIWRRAQAMQYQRGLPDGPPGPARRNPQSFDDIVDLEGKLKREEEEAAAAAAAAAARTTAAEPAPAEPGLRKRRADAARGDTPATLVASASPASLLDETDVASPGLPPPLDPQAAPHAAASAAAPASRSSPSEHAPALTPTTSRAPSTFAPPGGARTPSASTGMSPGGARTPSASTGMSPAGPRSPRSPQPPPTDFRSVREWAEASTASFYSPPASAHADEAGRRSGRLSSVASMVGSEAMSEGELLSEVGSGALRTPETWTEVGSVLSEEL